MASDYATSVQGLALRITPLDANGVPGSAYYVTRQFISMGFTPEYEDGDEISEKNADGSSCVSYKAADTLKNVSIDLSICAPEPEIYGMLAGGTILGTPPEKVGWASPVVGEAPANPVCLEVWSRAVIGGKMATASPYWHWVFPQASMRLSGDRTLENGLLANGFEGFSVGNPSAATALAAYLEAPWTYTTASPFQYARGDEIPVTFGPSTP